jgi:hypothetical protein
MNGHVITCARKRVKAPKGNLPFHEKKSTSPGNLSPKFLLPSFALLMEKGSGIERSTNPLNPPNPQDLQSIQASAILSFSLSLNRSGSYFQA